MVIFRLNNLKTQQTCLPLAQAGVFVNLRFAIGGLRMLINIMKRSNNLT